MKNPEAGNFNLEPAHEQPPLDKGMILERLLSQEITDEFGIEVTEEDLAWLSKEIYADDDSEFLEWLTSLAAQNGVDHEEFLERLGIPLDIGVEQNQKTE